MYDTRTLISENPDGGIDIVDIDEPTAAALVEFVKLVRTVSDAHAIRAGARLGELQGAAEALAETLLPGFTANLTGDTDVTRQASRPGPSIAPTGPEATRITGVTVGFVRRGFLNAASRLTRHRISA